MSLLPGFVPLMALLKVPLLTDYQPYHILRMVDNSCSNGKIRRFERKFYNGEVYVRALYGRRMERVRLFIHQGFTARPAGTYPAKTIH